MTTVQIIQVSDNGASAPLPRQRFRRDSKPSARAWRRAIAGKPPGWHRCRGRIAGRNV